MRSALKREEEKKVSPAGVSKPAQLARMQSAKRTKRDAGEEAFAAQSERALHKADVANG